MRLTRREYLRLAGCAGISRLTGLAAELAAPLFVEIPPKASAISFTHDAAMSQRRHLPETMGAGVAFLDYDNDGWMDLYMVNAGPCDFYSPSKPV